MDLEDLERIELSATVSAFRLESLPQYLVPHEDADFTAWRQGTWELPAAADDEWLAHIRATTDAGRHWARVHVLDRPLSEYAQFEIYGYQANQAAGERIYLADRTWHPALAELRCDFWLFDHDTAVVMEYDRDGRFQHPWQAPDARPYRHMQAVALDHAISLNDYLARYEPRLAT